ncbi:Allantoicase [Phaffia rhodozyma]|uniref:Allantoicase n=1 Tax=Phaffia rhodozyma TaxID=264483 RepID=A0A0F7SUX7_PHARH|nr:Allantoicase [Phaffia rhodozyma]
MQFNSLPISGFESVLAATTTEVTSVATGAEILDVSDDFFSPATDLLKVEPSVSMKGQFGPNGALFSGWESRRHNPDHDWVIIKLGPPSAFLKGFDIDTSFFSGNEAPAASVEGIYSPDAVPTNQSTWTPLIPKVPLGPHSRHLFTIPQTTEPYTHLRLRQYPDGGIARFRGYGIVSPIWGKQHSWDGDKPGQVDLAHAFNGGRCVYESDKHYGVGANLLLPGRGKDMGDGWETKRSRSAGHHDFVIIRLGAPGQIQRVDIDTLHYKGNFPAGVELHAINSPLEIPSLNVEEGWTQILSRTKVGPHEHHFHDIKVAEETVFTHVRMTIIPDGGVKRLRVYGTRAAPKPSESSSSTPATVAVPTTTPSSSSSVPTIAASPLTSSGFAPFGQVVQAFPDQSLAPRDIKVTSANGSTASKYHRLSIPRSTYPANSGAIQAFSCFRSEPPKGFGKLGGDSWLFESKMWERHPFTTQTFLPLGKDENGGLERGGEGMLVVVALNGKNDKPDVSTAKAFIASASQAITYDVGVWHHSVLSFVPTDFACLESQISTDGDRTEDCEIIQAKEGDVFVKVQVGETK